MKRLSSDNCPRQIQVRAPDPSHPIFLRASSPACCPPKLACSGAPDNHRPAPSLHQESPDENAVSGAVQAPHPRPRATVTCMPSRASAVRIASRIALSSSTTRISSAFIFRHPSLPLKSGFLFPYLPYLPFNIFLSSLSMIHIIKIKKHFDGLLSVSVTSIIARSVQHAQDHAQDSLRYFTGCSPILLRESYFS